MALFQPGEPRLPGAGRRPGTPNKVTAARQQGFKSAVQACREGGMDPITIMIESARFLRAVAAARGAKFTTPESLAKATDKEIDMIRRLLVDASSIAYNAAEFGYAKLQRIDYVGDVPDAPANVENKFVFVLNVGNDPGRPVTTINGNGHGGGNGHASAASDSGDDNN